MKILISFLIAAILPLAAHAQQASFYNFTVKAIDGKELQLSDFKGKKVMVVNVASKCGLTPQYAKLQTLYEKYAASGFVVIGFPANNFASQEPGTDSEISQFCSTTYGVTFPMAAKISVKGDDIAPLYRWLTSKSENGKLDADVSWNFQKFLIDPDGSLAGVFEPKTAPDSKEIVEWIEKP
ncbi:MAG: glutathione peroxidase [Tannerellaceae bacterium]|jgi:glutathione peroxidase|nr:glutathione peroxidase [Tannerellaceae bacterium]